MLVVSSSRGMGSKTGPVRGKGLVRHEEIPALITDRPKPLPSLSILHAFLKAGGGEICLLTIRDVLMLNLTEISSVT